MKNTIIIATVFLLIVSCSKEECVSCIAESKSGIIIENRLSCDSNDSYLNGFADGFKERYKDIDSVEVYCAYSE